MTLFNSIAKWFADKKWTISKFTFAGFAVVFLFWLKLGSSIPESKQVLLWLSPFLFGFFANLLVTIAEKTEVLVKTIVDQDPVRSSDAYELAYKKLKRVRLRKITPWKPIIIDMLGVTFKNSASWVQNDLLPFIKANPESYFELRMVFVDHKYLESLSLKQSDRPSDSKRREQWVRDVLWPASISSNGHLRVHVRTITNIPHWHGILIERRYLYLGRVSWDSSDERGLSGPMDIICAENGYRTFAVDDNKGGDDRVILFRSWMSHYLYGGHGGRFLCDNNSCFYKTGELVIPSASTEPDGKRRKGTGDHS